MGSTCERLVTLPKGDQSAGAPALTAPGQCHPFLDYMTAQPRIDQLWGANSNFQCVYRRLYAVSTYGTDLVLV